MNAFESKRKTIMAYRLLRENKAALKPAGKRLEALFDDGWTRLFEDVTTMDPLSFPGYREKLAECRRTTESEDALICGIGTIGGISAVACELDPDFLMGSMGTVVGEKMAMACEEADRRRLPLIVFCASGGARMQEGMYSLLQMVKTSAAVRRFKDHGGLYISVLTHPTTGGVSASFAFLGDVILAEPNALIGFAGPRVIERTIGEKLPKGFQRSEFQLEHGFIDRIVRPEDMKHVIVRLLKLHRKAPVFRDENSVCPKAATPVSAEETERVPAETCGETDPWKRVLAARSKDRPKITDLIPLIFDHFMELCGDRLGGEDPAILGGIATLGGIPVTVIGHRKGRDLKENIRCRFGMPEPEGYRKAMRLMLEAEKFGRPVISFIDTPGAYPGKEAEENGQSAAIAENIARMSTLRVPVISVVTGEGSSGGALGIGVADDVWMLENAVYSVLSPEGFATILWKDEKRTEEACRVMKMTAGELCEQGLCDRVIREPRGGLKTKDKDEMRDFGMSLREELTNRVIDLMKLAPDELTERRYEKYRHFEGRMAPARNGRPE
ncbi:MAG: acetyl-CoA carboxylase carboxyl transferase subunit alpha [Eubacteriales bacterium]|nr:acetyl-CoA carboxylase carboxyl transferase subunit alpha [Eubacteriales bacterium]